MTNTTDIDTSTKPRLQLSSALANYDPYVYGHPELHEQEFCKEIARKRYMLPHEEWTVFCNRVSRGIFTHRDDIEACQNAMYLGLFVPGGRILAAAGLDKGHEATLMNCYVSGVIEDSLESIYTALQKASRTLSMGGGIGYDFSKIRPKGATISSKRTGAAGPVHFMKLFDQSCKIIEQSGNRRGAQMAMLSIHHPDIEEFITSKSKKGELTQFNISVAVPDRFMKCLKNDMPWELFHNGKLYKTVKARKLWNLIMKHTYEYSEPGVFFIDRVNMKNPLRKFEEITTTNPCGEQPLPPNGNCNLGAINLARLVKHPFSRQPSFDLQVLEDLARLGTSFLDRVIDVTKYPLEEQREEALSKRRIGLGITGLANALDFLNLPYHSHEGREFARRIMNTIYRAADDESKRLGAELGNCLDGKFSRRNGTLTTIAPTGTTSIIVGNVSSGIEPTFAPIIRRTVRIQESGNDDETREVEVFDYGELVRRRLGVQRPLHNLVKQVAIDSHILMQQALTQWVDSSISKTINLPQEFSYEQFKGVYQEAYQRGLKSCTTYRPSDVRGSILEDAATEVQDPTPVLVPTSSEKKKEGRPPKLPGVTYKLEWPDPDWTIYVTINFLDDRPYEMFIVSAGAGEFMKALGIMISRRLQDGHSTSEIAKDLSQIYGDSSGRWIRGKWHRSIVGAIGHILQHAETDMLPKLTEDIEQDTVSLEYRMINVPSCPAGASKCPVANEGGCWKCITCYESKCE